MANLNLAMVAYVVISLSAIGVLLVLYLKCKNKGEGFCQGIGYKVCPNLPLLHKLYNEGKVTEFSDFANNPPQWQEMGWDKFTSYPDSPEKKCH